jgi:hypothetical protein
MMAERIWIIIAAFFAVAAGMLLWRNNLPAAFVTATLGAVAWFLSYRVQMRAKIAAAEEESNRREGYEETDKE